MTDQLSDRGARADHYFEQDLKGQRGWCDKRASTYKNWTQPLALVVIPASGNLVLSGLHASALGAGLDRRALITLKPKRPKEGTSSTPVGAPMPTFIPRLATNNVRN
jgi:hypothetical protein